MDPNDPLYPEKKAPSLSFGNVSFLPPPGAARPSVASGDGRKQVHFSNHDLRQSLEFGAAEDGASRVTMVARDSVGRHSTVSDGVRESLALFVRDSVAALKARPNRNVRVALAFTFFAMTARSVWGYTVQAGYLFALTGSATDVGISEGVQGCSQLAFALLTGRALRIHRRDKTLAFGGAFGAVSAAILIVFLALPGSSFVGTQRFEFLTGAFFFVGGYQGIWSTALETILADSTPTGSRSEINTLKFTITLLASCIGPLVASTYFYLDPRDHNQWTVDAMRNIFIIGVCLMIPPMALLCCFRDEDCLGKSADAYGTGADAQAEPQRRPSNIELSGVRSVAVGAEDRSRTDSGSDLAESVGHAEGVVEMGVVGGSVREPTGHLFILYMVGLNSLLGGLGAGMTVKFFPLYFQKLGLRPAAANLAAFASPITMTIFSQLATRLSRSFGRAKISMVFDLLGGAAFLLMGFLADMSSPPIPAVMAMFFLATAQKATKPLKKSVLMDFCPRRLRGTWNAIDSVTRFGWSGSAVAGGFLIDQYSYGAIFFVTAGMVFVAAACWPLIFARIEVAEWAARRDRAATAERAATRSTSKNEF